MIILHKLIFLLFKKESFNFGYIINDSFFIYISFYLYFVFICLIEFYFNILSILYAIYFSLLKYGNIYYNKSNENNNVAFNLFFSFNNDYHYIGIGVCIEN